MGSYDECKGYPVYTLKIIMLRVGVRSISYIFRLREHTVNISVNEKFPTGQFPTRTIPHSDNSQYFNQRKVTPTKYMVQLSATMAQTRETQLV